METDFSGNFKWYRFAGFLYHHRGHREHRERIKAFTRLQIKIKNIQDSVEIVGTTPKDGLSPNLFSSYLGILFI